MTAVHDVDTPQPDWDWCRQTPGLIDRAHTNWALAAAVLTPDDPRLPKEKRLMSRIWAWLCSCWCPRNRSLYACGPCGIRHTMTAQQYLAHQRAVHGPHWYLDEVQP